MAQSDVEVSNSALHKLGADAITALSDSNDRARACNLRIELCKRAVLRMHPWNFAIARSTLDGVAWTSLADNGGEVQLTYATHGLSTGNKVRVYSSTVASYVGTYTITKDDANSFTLDDSTYTATATGKYSLAPDHNEYYKLALPSGCLRILSINEEITWPSGRVEGRYIVSYDRPLEIRYINDVTDYTTMDAMFYETLINYLAWDICMQISKSPTLKDRMWLDFTNSLKRARFVDATEDTTQLLEANDWLSSRLSASRSLARSY